MAHNIDMAALRAFVTVAEAGGMTRAATLLNLTQGAVSQQIRRLEEQFDQRLFDRDRRGLRLTSAGERLMPRAAALLAGNDAIWQMMSAPDVAGEVRLGVPYDIVTPVMPPVLKAFAREWPRLRVRMVADPSATLLEMLADGALDLAMTTERHPSPHADVLAEEPLLWVGAAGGRAHLLDPVPLALGCETCTFRASVLEALAAQGRDWDMVCSNSDRDTMAAIVGADLGVAPMLRPGVPHGLRVLGPDSGLPPLPAFAIALYSAPAVRDKGPALLAEQIRRVFAASAGPAAKEAPELVGGP